MNKGNKTHIIINEYLQKKREGMDYTQIRKELNVKNFNQEEIKKIVQEIDDRILQEEFEKTGKHTSEIMKIGGWIFSITGFLLFLGRYTNVLFFHKNYMLAYGAILIGVILLFYGYIKTKKHKKRTKNSPKRMFS